MNPEESKPSPPKKAISLLRWFCHRDLLEDVEGDLHECFDFHLKSKSAGKAKWLFMLDVLLLFRPGIIRPFHIFPSLNVNPMLKTHLKISWRNLLKNKNHSLINIGGLASGMAVAMAIGLWIQDELSFNRSYENYDRIARVMQHFILPRPGGSTKWIPVPVGSQLKQSFGDDFKYTIMSSHTEDHIISNDNLSFSANGNYMQPEAPEMLTLKMLKGTHTGLGELNTIMLSESLAKKLFGEENPLYKIVKIDLEHEVKVTGIYEDLPKNSEFNDVTFIAPWALYVSLNKWLQDSSDSWEYSSVQTFVQLQPHAKMDVVSDKIKNLIHDRREAHKNLRIETSLHPMSKWHLYKDFKDGKNIGGQIQFVWLFGIIGVFVLLLACINFMNLSTASAESRTKEVGIRKALGSFRGQLIHQFFSESLLVAMVAFVIAFNILIFTLPWFNEVADKQMDIPLSNPWFWISCIGFTLLTGTIAGSYPALYLSSFQTVKALKGTFRSGRFAAVPRQILIVLQFTVSVTLIVGTIIVYRQIQHTKDRPVGYSRDGLIYLKVNTGDVHKHFDAIRNKLITSGTIQEMTESNGSVANYAYGVGGLEWRGKDPDFLDNFHISEVSPEYGKTVGWEIVDGRDFSRAIISDQKGLVINESAAKMMGLENPVGEIVKWAGKDWTILGVVNNLIVESPYQPILPAAYRLLDWPGNIVSLKISPGQSIQGALEKIAAVFKEYAPGLPFDYKFADEQYARKFNHEVRIGKLASVFAVLAILISCLGLLGLAAFMAKKRTKEIGIRKVVGASVFKLWKLMSKEFVLLVFVSCLIALPIAFFIMKTWLQNYEYRTGVSWWIFVAAGTGALVITLLTVSYQAIKAATASPVDSLRSE